MKHDKHESFLQAISIVFMVIARHAQGTSNSKFVISLEYLKKEVRDEFDLSHADKHETILQVDAINPGGHDQTCPNYPK